MVCVFVRSTAEPLASLVKQIDKKIDEHKNLKSFVVVMTKDGEKTKEELRKLAEDAGIRNVPLTMYQDSTGPPDYEIAKDADVTVLMWKRHAVKVNHAIKGEPTAKEVDSIVADISKLLGD